MNKMFGNEATAREEHEKRHLRSRDRIRINPAGTAPKPATQQPENTSTQQQASVLEAAAFLVLLAQPLSWLKLQDLLYYSQGWHLAWDGEPLFDETILASPDGVRIPVIQKRFADAFSLTAANLPLGEPPLLTASQQQTLSGMVQFYAEQSHFKLAGSIMKEQPWLAARSTAKKRSELPEISLAELRKYFESLE